MFPNESPVSQELPVSAYKKLEQIAFSLIIAMVVLVPLSFWPSHYVSSDLIKTLIIAIGTLGSAGIYIFLALKEKTLILPSKAISFVIILVSVSIFASALSSGHITKSLFGQGFEVSTASFLLICFLAVWVVFRSLSGRGERAVWFYVASVGVFFILFAFQALRFAFGPEFATFGILGSLTSTFVGTWNELGIYALLVVTILLSAIIFLPLSFRIKTVCWIMIALAAGGAFVVMNRLSWTAAMVVFLGMTIYVWNKRSLGKENSQYSWFKKIAWIPLLACLISVVMIWKGAIISRPVIDLLSARHTELSLPWQPTLDVASGAIKDRPLLGVGPNRFSSAYIAYKPSYINPTDAWGVEFNSGFAMVPTFFVTQGLLGGLSWLLFLVFLGLVGTKVLRQLLLSAATHDDPQTGSHGRFIVISSYAGTVFLWLTTLLYVPSHTMILYTFVLTGVFLGSACAYGLYQPKYINSISGTVFGRLFTFGMGILLALFIVWGLVYVKKATALFYFGSGIKHLSLENDIEYADNAFKKALAIDVSDIYWQARAEVGMAKVNRLVSVLSSANASGVETSASTSQALAEDIVKTINDAITYSRSAIAHDPDNYYNRLSEARVSRLAASLNMAEGYENALQAYDAAIKINRLNPAIYLDLAQLQASQNKLDLALQAVGAALQVKNNYIDAVFMLSQIYAAQGNLKDAITAATIATQINPQNPLLFFQLGLLEYNNKNYQASANALEKAVALSPVYANAHYFLGLSYSRLNQNELAIQEFTGLVESNPDNQEVALILSNLQSGRSPFTDAKLPVTPTPERRAKPPIQEN